MNEVSPASVPARQTLVATQVVFFVSVACCVMLAHPRDAKVDGISYFSVHAANLVPVATGYDRGVLGLR